MKTIGIIGGGFCGTMLAVNMIRLAKEPISIVIIEKTGKVCRGTAFGSFDPFHLLNVEAAKMGAFPSEPCGFYHWVKAKQEKFPGIEIAQDAYLPRQIFGTYIEEVWEDALKLACEKGVDLQIVVAEAVDLDGATIILNNGKKIQADDVIIAVGVPLNRTYPVKNFENYIPSIWSEEMQPFCNNLKKVENVAIIGSGLTMIDAFASLYERGYGGKIIVISPQTWLPEVHRRGLATYNLFIDPEAPPRTASRLVRKVRKEIKNTLKQGLDWRSILDALRPVTPHLWQSLPWKERARFIKHMLSFWNRHRHRMAPHYYSKLQEVNDENRMIWIKGKVISIDDTIKYRSSEDGSLKEVRADYVLNCSGPDLNVRRSNSALIQNLLKKGTIEPDPLNLGIHASDIGQINGHLYIAGLLLFGERLETIAVPELRMQCSMIADHLLNS